jgi:Protein of unknown function (DUF3485)
MRRIVFLTLATMLLLLDGLVYGRWTDRWGNSQVVEDSVARLEQVPLTVGDWQGKPLPAPDNQAKRAGCAGLCVWRYERRLDGATVNVMLACGRPGPLAVHTPDICYGGAGYTQSEAAAPYTAKTAGGAAPPEFWTAKFSKQDAPVPLNLRLFWSWHTRAGWQVARNPRLEFAAEPALYKLYVIHEMDGLDDRRDDAICADFITAFLPALQQALAAEP